jgi:hypothetical protein
LGYKPLRADRIHKAGHINAQVLAYIADAPLAVADLTGLNPNVMYELAVRHASGRPVCQLASSETTLPFDISGLRTVFFDLQDLDSVHEAMLALQAQLEDCVRSPQQQSSPFLDRDLIPVRLTDEQTRNLVHLHQASASFRMYRVIDEAVSVVEEHPGSFDPNALLLDLWNALMESRRLCSCFESRRLGKMFEFYDKTYSMDEAKRTVEVGMKTLLDQSLDSSLKRKRLLAYVHNAQLALDQRIEDALRMESKADETNSDENV